MKISSSLTAEQHALQAPGSKCAGHGRIEVCRLTIRLFDSDFITYCVFAQDTNLVSRVVSLRSCAPWHRLIRSYVADSMHDRGLGALLCQKFAAEGCNVAINYNSSPDRAKQVAEACEKHGVKAVVVQAVLLPFPPTVLAAVPISVQILLWLTWIVCM